MNVVIVAFQCALPVRPSQTPARASTCLLPGQRISHGTPRTSMHLKGSRFGRRARYPEPPPEASGVISTGGNGLGDAFNTSDVKDNVSSDMSNYNVSETAHGNGVNLNRASAKTELSSARVDVIDGNGAGRITDGSGGNGRDDDGEDGESTPAELAAILKAAGRSESSLGRVLREAVRQGSVKAEDLARALKVESGFFGSLIRTWPGLRNRLVANPSLGIQMGVELCVGFVTKSIAEIEARKERLWKEMPLVVSDLALELFGDAMLVWLLSPCWNATGRAGRSWIAGLPKHAAQIGAFSLPQRFATFVYKGGQFFLVGMASSAVGHGLTSAFVQHSRKSQAISSDDDGSETELGPMLPTCLAWGGFMLASSNPRYQAVNAIEQRAVEPLLRTKPLAKTAVTFVIRFGNCLLGGVQWIPWARFWGAQ